MRPRFYKTTMRETIISQLQQLRANTHIGDVLDILVISIILYFVLYWFRRKASRTVLIGIGIVVFVYMLTRVLNMYVTSLLFHAGFAAALVALVLIFQPEIRRSFSLLAGRRVFGRKRYVAVRLPVIDTIISTVHDFAESKTGALIVLQGRETLDRHTRGGVDVNGEVSYPLLCSIFDHHSAGHDGAVLVDHSRITRLGVLLPLSDNLQEVGAHGTRHTAALGISEESDALAIVVSEERGTISIARRGRLHPVDSSATLKQHIEGFYDSTFPEPLKRTKSGWLKENLGLKAVSLGLSALLWLLIAYRVEEVYRTVEVPIEYRNLPSGLIIEEQLPTEAKLTISGPERSFSASDGFAPVSIDLAKIDTGAHELLVDNKHVPLPPGLDLIRIEPGVIEFQASRKATVSLPIRVATSGELNEKIDIERLSAEPDSVSVRVDASVWGKVNTIPTEPLALETIKKDGTVFLKLQPPSGTSLSPRAPSTVRVKVHVRKE